MFWICIRIIQCRWQAGEAVRGLENRSNKIGRVKGYTGIHILSALVYVSNLPQ